MWQAILWAAAIAIAFCLWDSISRANTELESTQRVVVTLKRRKGVRGST
jgi:hypothetical protein